VLDVIYLPIIFVQTNVTTLYPMLLCEYKTYFSTPKRIIRCIYQHDFTLLQNSISMIEFYQEVGV